MFDYYTVYNAQTALVAGLITSVHCVAMCGPLACAWGRPQQMGMPVEWLLLSYHVSKLTAYCLVGAIAGAVGQTALQGFHQSHLQYLPWLLVVYFWDYWISIGSLYSKTALGRSILSSAHQSPKVFVPSFECGIDGLDESTVAMWALVHDFWTVFFSGSAIKGVEFSLGFGVGTIPLLWLAQSKFFVLQERLGVIGLERLQRAVAIIAMLVLIWRLRTTLGIGSSGQWICYLFDGCIMAILSPPSICLDFRVSE